MILSEMQQPSIIAKQLSLCVIESTAIKLAAVHPLLMLGHVAIIEDGGAPVVTAIAHFAKGVLATLLAIVDHKRTRVHQSGKCHSW